MPQNQPDEDDLDDDDDIFEDLTKVPKAAAPEVQPERKRAVKQPKRRGVRVMKAKRKQEAK